MLRSARDSAWDRGHYITCVDAEGVLRGGRVMAKRGRRSGLASLPTAAIERELRRRARRVLVLERRRDRIADKLAAMDAQIRAMGGSSNGRMISGRKRPRNETNLAEALAKVLKGKTMSVTEVAGAVQRAGYRTSAANFRVIVNQNLIKHRDLFKKVGRGQYTAA